MPQADIAEMPAAEDDGQHTRLAEAATQIERTAL